MITDFNLVNWLRSWFHAKDAAIHTGGRDVNTGGGDVIVGAGTVDGVDVGAHPGNTDAHHTEAHTVASHSDTSGTGSELNTLTDGSNADSLHAHAVGSHTIASHSDTTGTGAELNTLTDGSDASSLHDHDGRYFQESEFASAPGANSKPLETTASGHLQVIGFSVGAVGTSDGVVKSTSDMRAAGGLSSGSNSASPGAGRLLLTETTAPGTPSSGYSIIWCDSSGKLWFKNDAGTATQLAP